MTLDELATPALIVDADALAYNLETMSNALPGARMRPHVKAHKCTALAQRQAEVGHRHFTCATAREVVGMARAGLGEDLLLANEVVDGERLRAMAELDAHVTVAVDSDATIQAAASAGIRRVLIDVNVGMPRCGCAPDQAGALADLARRHSLEVRGVMGYEGHLMSITNTEERRNRCEESMQLLLEAHRAVGGDVISAGGTGTYAQNIWASEIQAGSYVLMDTAYEGLGLAFRPALWLLATVISVSERHAVADCGLKALGMDHGNSTVEGGKVWFFSDEHVTFAPNAPVRVGDRVRVQPAHIDPTIAYHEVMHPVRENEVLDHWDIDLRGW